MDGIRVLIVDDQPLLRDGLRLAFAGAGRFEVVGEASNGQEAIRLARLLNPDVVLMDINMPVLDGLQATREISGTVPGARVIILSMFDHDEYLFEALRAGACGFVLKESPPEKLIEAVHEVAAGESLLAPKLTRRLVAEFARRPVLSSAPPAHDLTQREREVFQLLIRGLSNEEIARKLTVGPSTVKAHIQHIYQKLGVRDRVQIVIYAYENGLI